MDMHHIATARDAVARLFPDQLYVPGSSNFNSARLSFWNARQKDQAPFCIFQPQDAEQVRAAIVEVAKANCPFAIKGGGHSPNSNGSASQGGFQFDLDNLDHIEIAHDRQTVRVGPGVHWGPLYQCLEKHEVAAVGGRDFGVGVPGFIFGGGISFFTNQHGWAVDNLVSADIVIANGELITVDESTHGDLFKALRGGAHNFGIVTSLTLKLYPHQGMWGGYQAVLQEHFDAVFDAYDVFTRDLRTDHKAHMVMDFFRKGNVLTGIQYPGYTEPTPHPLIFEKLLSIPSVEKNLRFANQSDLAREMMELTDIGGLRTAWWTFCMEYSIDLLRSVFRLWCERTEIYDENWGFAIDINHITPTMRNKAAREGPGEIYGLQGDDEPLTNVLLVAQWTDEKDDEEVVAILQELSLSLEELVRKCGKSHAFRYMNYAHTSQDCISGYGEENRAFLIEVSARYDPEGVFQKLQSGPFKLKKTLGQ